MITLQSPASNPSHLAKRATPPGFLVSGYASEDEEEIHCVVFHSKGVEYKKTKPDRGRWHVPIDGLGSGAATLLVSGKKTVKPIECQLYCHGHVPKANKKSGITLLVDLDPIQNGDTLFTAPVTNQLWIGGWGDGTKKIDTDPAKTHVKGTDNVEIGCTVFNDLDVIVKGTFAIWFHIPTPDKDPYTLKVTDTGANTDTRTDLTIDPFPFPLFGYEEKK